MHSVQDVIKHAVDHKFIIKAPPIVSISVVTETTAVGIPLPMKFPNPSGSVSMNLFCCVAFANSTVCCALSVDG